MVASWETKPESWEETLERRAGRAAAPGCGRRQAGPGEHVWAPPGQGAWPPYAAPAAGGAWREGARRLRDSAGACGRRGDTRGWAERRGGEEKAVRGLRGLAGQGSASETAGAGGRPPLAQGSCRLGTPRQGSRPSPPPGPRTPEASGWRGGTESTKTRALPS